MAAPGRPPPSYVPFHEQLYNHIAWQRDMPSREDRNLPSIESALLTHLTGATCLLSSYVALSDQQHIPKLVDSLTACQSLHVDRATRSQP